MKLNKISQWLLMLSISALAVACEETNDAEYEGPGEPVVSDCPKVYFSPDNKAEYNLTGDEELAIDIIIKRRNTNDAVDVPVNFESEATCFNLAESVHFDAGSDETTLRISFPEIPSKEVRSFTLSIPEEYTDTYSMDNQVYNADVLVAKWLKIVPDAEFYGICYQTDEVNVYELSDIYWLDGQNRFRISNFLGSGIDLTFTFNTVANYVEFDAADPDTWYGYVEPLDHYKYYSATRTDLWQLCNDEGEPIKWATPYTGYEIDCARTSRTSCFQMYSEAYGWYMYFVSPYEGYEDEHGWFRITNTKDTYIWIYWEPELLNINGYDDNEEGDD